MNYYSILKDDDLREIQDKHGVVGLQLSEEYSENSVFTQDPYEIYNNFFSGEDEEVRQYLLLHGPSPLSDDEQDMDDDDDDDDAEKPSDEDESETELQALRNNGMTIPTPCAKPRSAVIEVTTFCLLFISLSHISSIL